MSSKETIVKELERRKESLRVLEKKIQDVNGLLKEHTVSSYLVRGEVALAKQCAASRVKLLKEKKQLVAEENDVKKSVTMAEERLSLYEKDDS